MTKKRLSLEEIETAQAEALKKAKQDVGNLGIEPSARPRTKQGEFYSGALPPDIADASLSTITRQSVMQTEYANYLEECLVDAELELKMAKEALSAAQAEIRLSITTGNKEVKTDLTLTHPKYVKANASYLRKQYTHDAIKTAAANARRNISTLSRLISAEQVANNNGKQSHNASGGNSRRPFKRR